MTITALSIQEVICQIMELDIILLWVIMDRHGTLRLHLHLHRLRHDQTARIGLIMLRPNSLNHSNRVVPYSLRRLTDSNVPVIWVSRLHRGIINPEGISQAVAALIEAVNV